jgi:hypothetical protein
VALLAEGVLASAAMVLLLARRELNGALLLALLLVWVVVVARFNEATDAPVGAACGSGR